MVASITFTAWVGRTLKESPVEALVVARQEADGMQLVRGRGIINSSGRGRGGGGGGVGGGGSVTTSGESAMISVCSRSRGQARQRRPETW